MIFVYMGHLVYPMNIYIHMQLFRTIDYTKMKKVYSTIYKYTSVSCLADVIF